MKPNEQRFILACFILLTFAVGNIVAWFVIRTPDAPVLALFEERNATLLVLATMVISWYFTHPNKDE